MSEKTEHTRDHILTVGRELISSLGFNALGLGQLLKEAKVPKGSFYHYFASKEEFGCVLLEQYIDLYHQNLDALWHTEGLTAREQLQVYWDRWCVLQCPVTSHRTCLIVKLGAEVSDMSDSMRQVLCKGADSIIERLADKIRDGIRDGSLASHLNADETAAMLYQMWLGASLLAKIQHSNEPLKQAKESTEKLLPAAAS